MYSIKRDGKVKKFFSNKGFGFIEGSDGIEYFFHKSDIQSYHIKEGDFVEFVPGKNLKGYIAKNITLEYCYYDIPDGIFDHVPEGYEILDCLSSYINISFDIDENFRYKDTEYIDTDFERVESNKNKIATKKWLIKYAKLFGANAILNVKYKKEIIERAGRETDEIYCGKDSCGGDMYVYIPGRKYRYEETTHTYTAHLARIGTRNLNIRKQKINKIHKIPLDILIKKYEEKKKLMMLRFSLFFIISFIYLCGFFEIKTVFGYTLCFVFLTWLTLHLLPFTVLKGFVNDRKD